MTATAGVVKETKGNATTAIDVSNQQASKAN
jgi:hypothetical protein